VENGYVVAEYMRSGGDTAVAAELAALRQQVRQMAARVDQLAAQVQQAAERIEQLWQRSR
jgi:outer membrane murein-binding lipoprotein Lpp